MPYWKTQPQNHTPLPPQLTRLVLFKFLISKYYSQNCYWEWCDEGCSLNLIAHIHVIENCMVLMKDYQRLYIHHLGGAVLNQILGDQAVAKNPSWLHAVTSCDCVAKGRSQGHSIKFTVKFFKFSEWSEKSSERFWRCKNANFAHDLHLITQGHA